MRPSRPAVLLLLLLLVCAGIAALALALVPARPIGTTPAVVATLPPLSVDATPVAPPPPLAAQDFPSLASLAPLGPSAALTPADLLPPPDAPGPVPVFRLRPGERPLIAIVIDDMGPNVAESRRALRLPAPITLAFLPYAKGVAGLAAQAKAAGHELIVHVPMQPLDSRQNTGPQALLTDLGREELQRRLRWNLDQFKGYVGINNHMGSRFTADANGMNIVMEELSARGLFFLDSRTIGRTAARSAAARHGVPLLERDVFIDDTDTPAAVAAQLEQTLRVARRRGKAIAIGHPRPFTMTALERWLPAVVAEGYELVPLSRILEQTTQPTAHAVTSAETPHAAR